MLNVYSEFRRVQMGLYSCGAFTPIEFFYHHGQVCLRRHREDTAGVLVATITN